MPGAGSIVISTRFEDDEIGFIDRVVEADRARAQKDGEKWRRIKRGTVVRRCVRIVMEAANRQGVGMEERR